MDGIIVKINYSSFCWGPLEPPQGSPWTGAHFENHCTVYWQGITDMYFFTAVVNYTTSTKWILNLLVVILICWVLLYQIEKFQLYDE